MNFINILKYFSSKSNEGYPYSVVPTTSTNVYDVIRNYSVNTSVSLSAGIYFEIVSGNLVNSSTTSQLFLIKIKNPNNINISSSTIFLRIYSKLGSTLTLLSSISIGTIPTHDSIISIMETAQNFVITLETSSDVLYSSEDYINNYLPVNQNIKVHVINTNSTIFDYFIFYKEPIHGSFLGVDLNTRTTTAILHSTYANVVDQIYIYENNLTNVIGTFANENVVTDYKFPRTYLLVPYNERNRISTTSLLFSYFIKDIYSDVTNFNYVVDTTFLNNLAKVRGFLYNSYYYNVTSYSIYDNFASLKNILLILFLIKERYNSLSSIYQSYYDSILTSIKNFIPLTYTALSPLIPDYLNATTEDQYSLSTNLLLLDLYRFFSLNAEYNALKTKIQTEFLNSSIYEIINVNSVHPITEDDPLSLYIIKFLLPVHFSGMYSSIISDVDNKLLNLSVAANIVTIVTSSTIGEDFNPIYTFNPVISSEILYKTKFSATYSLVDFSSNLIIKYLQGNNNIVNLYSVQNNVYLAGNKFSISNNHFILPNFFSSLLNEYFKYSPSILSLYSYANVDTTPPTSITVVNYRINQIGTQLEISIELNSAARIMFIVFDKLNPALVYYYFISNSSSVFHNFYINTTIYPINPIQMDSGIILLR